MIKCKKDDALNWLIDNYGIGTVLVADGMGKALIGVTEASPDRLNLACYDFDQCIEVLVMQGMARDEALEYLEFNTLGAWVGEQIPLFLRLKP